MANSSKRHEGSPPPQEAETMGLRNAIIWLGHLGLSNVHFELDCKLVVVDNIMDRTNNQPSLVRLYLHVVSFATIFKL